MNRCAGGLRHLRRAERGQSALAECVILLPTYVVLIFAAQTFGEMGLLKKKAIMSARFIAFGGSADDAKKLLMTDKWVSDVKFGDQKVEITSESKNYKIKYTPMKIMQSADGSGQPTATSSDTQLNPFEVRGGLKNEIELTDDYDVDK